MNSTALNVFCTLVYVRHMLLKIVKTQAAFSSLMTMYLPRKYCSQFYLSLQTKRSENTVYSNFTNELTLKLKQIFMAQLFSLSIGKIRKILWTTGCPIRHFVPQILYCFEV